MGNNGLPLVFNHLVCTITTEGLCEYASVYIKNPPLVTAMFGNFPDAGMMMLEGLSRASEKGKELAGETLAMSGVISSLMQAGYAARLLRLLNQQSDERQEKWLAIPLLPKYLLMGGLGDPLLDLIEKQSLSSQRRLLCTQNLASDFSARGHASKLKALAAKHDELGRLAITKAMDPLGSFRKGVIEPREKSLPAQVMSLPLA